MAANIPVLATQLARIDGRSSVGRRVKCVTKQLREQLRPRQRLTQAEREAIRNTAELRVLAETAVRKGLLGEIPTLDAVRANSCAMRAERELRRAIVLVDEAGNET